MNKKEVVLKIELGTFFWKCWVIKSWDSIDEKCPSSFVEITS